MHVVAIKHPETSRIYLYEAPSSAYLVRGDKVIVKNARGEAEGVCMSDAVYASDDTLNLVCALLNLNPNAPLARVVGKISVTRYD